MGDVINLDAHRDIKNILRIVQRPHSIDTPMYKPQFVAPAADDAEVIDGSGVRSIAVRCCKCNKLWPISGQRGTVFSIQAGGLICPPCEKELDNDEHN